MGNCGKLTLQAQQSSVFFTVQKLGEGQNGEKIFVSGLGGL